MEYETSSPGTVEGADADRVELTWPGKHSLNRLLQDNEGRWAIHASPHKAVLRGLARVELVHGADLEGASLLIGGQRHDALSALSRSIGPVVKLAYVDLPRLKVDDVSTAFQSASPLRLTTWLAMVRSFLIETRELLSRTGVVAVHCGEDEAQYARIILEELFREKRVGTIVWQKAYSARHMPGMKSFTDTHDLIYIYARDLDAIPAVGLRRLPKDYSNSDGDPRGAWKAEHKGAKTRRENSDFDTYQPPYRWQIVEGQLPPGLWRLSPFTGVIWGKTTAVGDYAFVAEVTDSAGKTARKNFTIKVAEAGEVSSPPEIPWIFEEIKADGPLRIVTKALPIAILGKVYSTALFASGGAPFLGKPIRPGSGRYWDFAKSTLISAYQADAVYLGSKQPTSIPTPKKYEPPAGVMEVENQQSIWLGRSKDSKATEVFAGFTEDATKHLKALKSLQLIDVEVPTAKPEQLMLRLLDIFTAKGDAVLEVMSSTADLTAVALKSGRRAIALQGGSKRDREITAKGAVPRLKAVLSGEDWDLENRAPDIRLSKGAYIPFSGGGSLATADVGPDIAVLEAEDDYATLTDALSSMSEDDIVSAVLTAEGFLPSSGRLLSKAIVGNRRAMVVPPKKYLTPELISTVASNAIEDSEPISIYYFRGTEDIDEKLSSGRVVLRRVPYDLLRLDIV